MILLHTLRDFFHFLKVPTPHFRQVPLTLRTVLLLFGVVSILRVGSVLADVGLIRPLVREWLGQELARQTFPAEWSELLVGALLVAPWLEELAYRWGLRFSAERVAWSVGLVVFYWLPLGGTYSTNLVRVLDQPGFYLMGLVALVAGLTTYALLRVPLLAGAFQRRWERYFGVIFYGSALLFGLMHVSNVRELSATVWLLAPFITIQQIVFGLVNGYVRVRFGFAQAVVQHMLFNLVPIALRWWYL
ncbi:hypothetical protein GCM10027275_07260 [Rhabdobacter roseus]|uniref:CAAX prenyl protease 2/Lysostaphin resistance protein A-like domain-containing protein n=1 Tax=Rhabdobacter roseus TaxID=1655419 RepID=A0A840TN24_9BACT|nr:CPBP family glutamic-type intramembrane protease [Rhabdobacter roseus]MBB5282623.1 hypothetical protein [Rhabdobacter roseus]